MFKQSPIIPRNYSRWFVSMGVFFIILTNSAWACVGCRVTTDEVARVEPSTVTAGFAFSWSVLFMLVVVGFVITFLVSYIARAVARLDAKNQPPM
ncbi:MAG: hypothetical protein ACOVMP_10605 [Chthoniobacterales bacterium]